MGALLGVSPAPADAAGGYLKRDVAIAAWHQAIPEDEVLECRRRSARRFLCRLIARNYGELVHDETGEVVGTVDVVWRGSVTLHRGRLRFHSDLYERLPSLRLESVRIRDLRTQRSIEKELRGA